MAANSKRSVGKFAQASIKRELCGFPMNGLYCTKNKSLLPFNGSITSRLDDKRRHYVTVAEEHDCSSNVPVFTVAEGELVERQLSTR